MKIKGCKSMSQDWKDSINESKWWASGYDLSKENLTDMQKELLKLRDKLLTYGGEEVCLPTSDEDIEKLLSNRARLFVIHDDNEEVGQIVHYDELIGLPSQCHRNSCFLYNCDEVQAEYDFNVKIMTGYALSDDGMWRQHSWCICDAGEDYIEDSIIIETTEERLAYYGFIMNEEESEEFSSWY